MTAPALHQLLLPLEKKTLLRFADFDPSDNPMVFALLQNGLPNSRMIYLQGPESSGKTHLAEALAAQYLNLNKEVILFSGKTAPPIHFFYEIPAVHCLIIDDIDALLAFSPKYEEALFALYNQIFDKPNIRLLITSTLAIDKLPLRLKDLSSRLTAMLQLNLNSPSASNFPAILKLHARRLGITLSDGIIKFLLKDNSRPLEAHLQTLKKLAEQSLKEQKRLSLAYVKHMLQ